MFCIVENDKFKTNDKSSFFKITSVDYDVAKKICDMLSGEKKSFVVLESKDCNTFNLVYMPSRYVSGNISLEAIDLRNKNQETNKKNEEVEDPIDKAERWIKEHEELMNKRENNKKIKTVENKKELNSNKDDVKKDRLNYKKRKHHPRRIRDDKAESQFIIGINSKEEKNSKENDKIKINVNGRDEEVVNLKDNLCIVQKQSNEKIENENNNNRKIRKHRRKIHISEKLRNCLKKGANNIRKKYFADDDSLKYMIGFFL